MSQASGPIRVLHVDDEPDVAEMAGDALERERDDLVVETVASATEGMDRLADGGIDCIVSGHDMPGWDGIEFLEAVREEHPDLPFILFTGSGSEDLASDAISAGVTDYLRTDATADTFAILANRIVNAVRQYRAERAAERTQQRLAELTEHTNDILWMFSGDWSELLFINSTYEEVWGRSIEALEADATDFLDGIHPEDRERVRGAMQRLSDGRSVDIEYRVNEAEDYGRWVWVQGEPIADENGDVVRVTGFARDITERKERERDLARERRRYATLFETLPNPVLHATAEGGEPVVRDVNPAFEDTFGYDAETIRGRPLHDFILPDDREREAETLNRRILNEGEVRTEVRRETADGRRTFQLDVAVREAGDDVAEGYAVYTDITEREERKHELERKNERLEEFASIVSHDLRNPLNVAEARLELIAEECDSEHLDAVARAHDRMDDLIGDLLTLARTGEEVTEVDPVALPEVIERCWGTVETADATLEIDASRTIRADEARLQQLLENLIRNAVEHGGEDVTVTVDDLDDGFYVADDGDGIPEDERDRVFEAGYSSTDDGTGFGLNIVGQVADAHGWTVDVTESRDGGARFEITGVEPARSDGGY